MMGAALMGSTCAARLMLFVGGPSTSGNGKIVDTELTEAIRSHKVHAVAVCQVNFRSSCSGGGNGRCAGLQDLVKDAAPFWKKARKFYEGAARQLVAQGHALDVFACSLDQVGLAEMKMPVEATGGIAVQTDTFNNPVFRESLARLFARPGESQHVALSSNATFEVRSQNPVPILPHLMSQLYH